MTCAELIEVLRQHPGEMEVAYADYCCYGDILFVWKARRITATGQALGPTDNPYYEWRESPVRYPKETDLTEEVLVLE